MMGADQCIWLYSFLALLVISSCITPHVALQVDGEGTVANTGPHTMQPHSYATRGRRAMELSGAGAVGLLREQRTMLVRREGNHELQDVHQQVGEGQQSGAATHNCGAPPPRDLPSVPGRATTVIVVLGGPTQGLKPGPWLEWRLQAAMKLYKQQSPDTTSFLVTGGRPKSYGSCGAYSEAAVMQKWLENEGIVRGVWREDRSNHTLDNAALTWARLTDLQQRGLVAPGATVHIVTHPWHMIKASECFKAFFQQSGFHTHYDSTAAFKDDTMTPFEQESYADMYRMQLRNWLPWQFGFHRGLNADNHTVVAPIDAYVVSNVESGKDNVFFLDGLKAAAASSHTATTGSPMNKWSRINDLQWRLFLQSLDSKSDDKFVPMNAFSRWGSLRRGRLPRYVTAFNSRRDSGDLLGLQCPGACGRRYDALRVVAFLYQARTRKGQIKALDVARDWAETSDIFSPETVALFALRRESRHGEKWSLADAEARLKGWSASALSKKLDSANLEWLERKSGDGKTA